MIIISRLKKYTIAGFLFVLITGTLAHFVYGWTNNNFISGLFFPVNESTWEHMKLVFFPMLIYAFFMYRKLSSAYPCLSSSLPLGIIAGTLIMPVIFYTYKGVLGYNLFILDLITFLLCVMTAFFLVYKLALSCTLKYFTPVLLVAVIILMACFLFFTYYPPDIGLFADAL